MNNTRTTQSLLLDILLCFALLGFLRFLLLLIALVLWTRLRFGLGVPLSFFSFFCSLLAQQPHLLYMHSLPPPLFVQHLVGQLTTIVGSISHSTNLHRLPVESQEVLSYRHSCPLWPLRPDWGTAPTPQRHIGCAFKKGFYAMASARWRPMFAKKKIPGFWRGRDLYQA